VVSRVDLLKGRTAADWSKLYDAGYRAYWAGQYAQAVEYCAAAAELEDDARAWYYLSLALLQTGDTQAAGEAARFAASRAQTDAQSTKEALAALSRVQGPVRDRLSQLQSEVTSEATAPWTIARRPTLIKPPVASSTVLTAR
jgi:tetratricopeptide (TPR) repeat protein